MTTEKSMCSIFRAASGSGHILQIASFWSDAALGKCAVLSFSLTVYCCKQDLSHNEVMTCSQVTSKRRAPQTHFVLKCQGLGCHKGLFFKNFTSIIYCLKYCSVNILLTLLLI